MQYLVSQLKKYRVFEGTMSQPHSSNGANSMSYFSHLFGSNGVPSPNNGVTGGGGRSNSNNANSNNQQSI